MLLVTPALPEEAGHPYFPAKRDPNGITDNETSLQASFGCCEGYDM